MILGGEETWWCTSVRDTTNWLADRTTYAVNRLDMDVLACREESRKTRFEYIFYAYTNYNTKQNKKASSLSSSFTSRARTM